jgi:hypothetical protein
MDLSYSMGKIAEELRKIIEENKKKEAFLIAAESGDTGGVLRMVVKDTRLLEARTKEDNTALMLAAKKNRFETVKNLLKIDAQIIDLKNQNGDTALMFAAWEGNTQIVAHLIENNADILIINKQGNNALMLAAKNHHDKTVFQLMAALSPHDLALLKWMPELKPFVFSFELQTQVQGQRMVTTKNELWEKPKTRARQKQVKPSAPISHKGPETITPSESRSINRSAMACDSWRSGGSSALTFVAPVAVKKSGPRGANFMLDPSVPAFMPETPSKKEYDLNFPPLSASKVTNCF